MLEITDGSKQPAAEASCGRGKNALSHTHYWSARSFYAASSLRGRAMIFIRRYCFKLFLILSVVFCAAPAMHASADTWRGTAPFCKGRCLPGETEIARNSNGNGGHCISGSKALCRNASALCVPRQTRTSCAALVMICDNGFYSTPDVWHSCSKYACGACLGF